MIPVAPAPEPPTFRKLVRDPGERAIAEMVGKPPRAKRTAGVPYQKQYAKEEDIPPEKLPAYWTKALGLSLIHISEPTRPY